MKPRCHFLHSDIVSLLRVVMVAQLASTTFPDRTDKKKYKLREYSRGKKQTKEKWWGLFEGFMLTQDWCFQSGWERASERERVREMSVYNHKSEKSSGWFIGFFHFFVRGFSLLGVLACKFLNCFCCKLRLVELWKKE